MTAATKERRKTNPAPDPAARRPAPPPSHDPDNLSPEEEETFLQDVENSRRMYMATLSDWYTFLVDHLMNRKRLPSFYFIEAAKVAGIPPETYKNWKFREWPNYAPRNPQKVRDITQTLMFVMCRLNPYPWGETYFEALERLQNRIVELKEKYNQNALTEVLNLPHNTIENILTSTSRPQAKFVHCPWRLLDKLANAESAIDSATKMEMPEYGYLHNGNGNGRTSEEDDLLSDRAIRDRIIEPRGNCRRCGSSWAHLRYDGPFEGRPGRSEYVCMACASENYVVTSPIERHSRCPGCGWSWWWMKRKAGTPAENLIMVCTKCGMENRVTPKGIPAEGYEKIHGIKAKPDYETAAAAP